MIAVQGSILHREALSRTRFRPVGICRLVRRVRSVPFLPMAPIPPDSQEPRTVERIADAIKKVGRRHSNFNQNRTGRDGASRYRALMESPANSLARGVMRLFAELGKVAVSEFALPSGHRADIATLARDGEISIVEIKSSVADFRSDTKWPEYLEWCDYFYFGVPEGFPRGLLPIEEGLIIADAYGGDVLRIGKTRPLNANRRKSLTLRFARTTASRLQSLTDPDFR